MTEFDSTNTGEDLPLEITVPVSDYTAAPTEPKRKVRVVALAVGLVAALGAGAFAVTQLGSSTDGADSPRAALDQMVNAINSSDVIGVLESLPPGERAAIIDPIKNINTELQRVGIVAKDNDLKSFKGAGVKITGVEATTTNLSDEVASVDISKATVTTSFDTSKLPIGDELKKLAFKNGLPTKTGGGAQSKTTGEAVHLIAIKEGGGWHMSLLYSAADAARRSAKLENPKFGSGVASVGGDTPEAAALDMMNTIGRLDVKHLIELTPPDEMRALHDYAPLFLDKAVKSIDNFKTNTPVDASFAGSEFAAKVTGDQAVVSIKKLAAAGQVAGFDFKVSGDDKCSKLAYTNTKTSETKTFDSCKAAKAIGGNESMKKFSDLFKDLKFNKTEIGLVFVQRGGKWFFSPLRTTLDAYVGLLKALGDTTITDIVKKFNEMGGLSSLTSGLRGTTTQTTLTPDPSTTDSTSTTTAVDPGAEAMSKCSDGVYADTSLTTDALRDVAMTKCVEGLVTAGTVKANDVAEYLYPECVLEVRALALTATQAESDAAHAKADKCLADKIAARK